MRKISREPRCKQGFWTVSKGLCSSNVECLWGNNTPNLLPAGRLLLLLSPDLLRKLPVQLELRKPVLCGRDLPDTRTNLPGRDPIQPVLHNKAAVLLLRNPHKQLPGMRLPKRPVTPG